MPPALPFALRASAALESATYYARPPVGRALKRGTDILLAGIVLIILAPLFCVVFIVVRRDDGPAFFRQTRIGRNSKRFTCYKFRSMRVDAERALILHLAQNPEATDEWRRFQKLKNDVRVTSFGRFMRRASIDELPQLINVIRGDMSLVGPRPCTPDQESYYAENFGLYESMRPGITGLWQVSGRNALTFQERVALDAWYAHNWSLWLDIRIILKTAPALFKRGQAF